MTDSVTNSIKEKTKGGGGEEIKSVSYIRREKISCNKRDNSSCSDIVGGFEII